VRFIAGIVITSAAIYVFSVSQAILNNALEGLTLSIVDVFIKNILQFLFSSATIFPAFCYFYFEIVAALKYLKKAPR